MDTYYMFVYNTKYSTNVYSVRVITASESGQNLFIDIELIINVVQGLWLSYTLWYVALKQWLQNNVGALGHLKYDSYSKIAIFVYLTLKHPCIKLVQYIKHLLA